MKTLQQKLRALPVARRRRIEQRTAVLVAEEMSLRELRKARKITQTALADTLGVKQEQVSRIERRTDLHLSTLRRSIQAMGGDLQIIAIFPEGGSVRLTGFADL